MAINAVNATIERRARGAEREARGSALPIFRSLRHGVPAATYTDRNRSFATVSRSDADRALFETWGWG